MAVAAIIMSIMVVAVPASPAHAVSVAAIDLGRAASFAILAGDSVGNTATGPTTIVRGDLGVLAGAGGVTGFPPGEVHGTWYASGATEVVDAHADLVAAYAEAASRTSNFALAGDLIGKTLAPGVHTNAGAVANTGTVTLDGGGDPNAVFIFQVGGALAMAAGSHVILTGGTQAKNVFWQVNGAGAIGATADFAGTLMTAAAIGVGADTVFNGRALAKTGAITTNSNQFYSAPPAVTIDGGSTLAVADNTPTISGTATMDVPTTVTVTIGTQTLPAAVQSNGTWVVTATILANGTYTVTAVGSDAVGNTGTAVQALTIDTVPPVVTINGGAVRVTNDSTPTIDGTSDITAGSLVTVTVGVQTLTTLVQSNATWSVTASLIADGAHSVSALVHDQAGNPGSASQTLGIDATAPVVAINGGATALTSDSTPALSGTITGGTVTVSIDGLAVPGVTQVSGNWTAAFPAGRSPLGGGDHYVAVTGTDAAGNVSSASQTLTVDTTLPTISIAPGSSDATNDQTPTISGTTDAAAGVTVTVTIDGGSVMTTLVQPGGTWNVTPPSLTPGLRTIVASVPDPAGNVGTATQTLTIDVTSPTVSIVGGPSHTTADATPTLTGSSDATAGSAVAVTVNGQTLPTTIGAGGSWSVTAATIANGTYGVLVTVTDAAGNAGNAIQSLTINAVPPVVTIAGGTDTSTSDVTPIIQGTSDAATGSAVVVTVAAQTLHATVQPGGTWNVTAASITLGTEVVTVSVTDAAGNVGVATQNLTIDSAAPTNIEIAGGAARSTSDDTPTISGTTDAANGRIITVTVDGQSMPVSANLGTWSVTAVHVADGTYVVNVSVTAGGTPGSASQNLTIDTVAPVVVPTGGGSVDTTDSTPAITGSGAPPGASVTVTVAGQTMTTTVGPDGTWSVIPTNPLPVGANQVVITITDSVGNQGTGTQVVNVAAAPVGAATPDFVPVGPKRVFDTRLGQSPNALRTVVKQQVNGSYELQVQMTDLAGLVPAGGVGAVSLNVTSTGSTAAGFITVYGCGTRELVSSVNFPAGGTVANAVIAPVSAAGTVCFFANTSTDIIVDINGWFATGAAFTSVGPKRVFDTRAGASPEALRLVTSTKIPANGMIEVRLTDLIGYVPAGGVGSVSLNVTVTNPEASGFITVYACGARAAVSSVNFVAGQTVANAVIAPVSASGTVCFYSMAATDLVVDINGWLQTGSGFKGIDPARVLDTRRDNSPDALRVVPKAKIGGNNILEVRVTDLAGRVPADGVDAVSLNVTAANPEAAGFITVFACGAMEAVSTLNFSLGATVANAVMTPVSATGTICLYSNTQTDVIVDINGWIGNAQSG